MNNLPFKPTGNPVELVAMIQTPAGDRFALAKLDMSNEHVTWAVGNDGSCFWGHYGLSFAEGLNDLYERAK